MAADRHAPGLARHVPPGASLALAELRGFPAKLLSELPLEVRIVVQARGIAPEIVLGAVRESDPIGFGADELRALVIGAEAERLWPADFRGFCLRKRQDSSFRLTVGLALAGAQPDPRATWSLERVLDWLELELTGFEWVPADDAPEPPAASQTGGLAAA